MHPLAREIFYIEAALVFSFQGGDAIEPPAQHSVDEMRHSYRFYPLPRLKRSNDASDAMFLCQEKPLAVNRGKIRSVPDRELPDCSKSCQKAISERRTETYAGFELGQ